MELATVANANEGKDNSVVCSCSSEANMEASVTCLRANTQPPRRTLLLSSVSIMTRLQQLPFFLLLFPFGRPEQDNPSFNVFGEHLHSCLCRWLDQSGLLLTAACVTQPSFPPPFVTKRNRFEWEGGASFRWYCRSRYFELPQRPLKSR